MGFVIGMWLLMVVSGLCALMADKPFEPEPWQVQQDRAGRRFIEVHQSKYGPPKLDKNH